MQGRHPECRDAIPNAGTAIPHAGTVQRRSRGMTDLGAGYTGAMSKTTTRVMTCAPQAVLDVLSDGWTYVTWVVGASRIRAVDADWPAVGSHVHHSVGAWPLLIDDDTTVEERVVGRSLQLKVRAWPTGEGRVLIEVLPHTDGCEVRITEAAVGGPAVLIPAPVEGAVLHWRNTESLRRLAFLAEGKSEGLSTG